MDNTFRVVPIGNAKCRSYGYAYDTAEEAIKESYFYLCYVAKSEADIDEACIEYRICPSKRDDTEFTIYKAHIKYVYNPKKKLIEEIKFLSFESFPIDVDHIKRKSIQLQCTQGDDEWITSYPNLVMAMRDAKKDWFRGYVNFDVDKKMKVTYTTHGKTMFEADVKLIWNGDGTTSIQFIKVKNIRKEEDKKANEEWKSFLKKMEGKEINL